jgi:hypothetical protein
LAQKQIGALQGQVAAAQQSAAAIQRQMRIDQRPWIYPLVGLPDQVIENTTLTATVHYTNSGKSPAKNVTVRFWFEAVPAHQEPAMRCAVPYLMGTTGVLFPGFGDDYNVNWERCITNPADRRPIIVNHTDAENLNGGNSFIIVYGRIDYSDVFGVRHWTTSCHWKAFRGGGYTAKRCADYNNVDNN